MADEIRDEARSRQLLGGSLGRALLASLAGLDMLRLIAAAGEPVPEGVAFFTTRPGDEDAESSQRDDANHWPAEWASSGRDVRDVIAAAVADTTETDILRWRHDEAELLQHVASVAESWAFGPRWPDAADMLAQAADLLRPLADAVASAPAARWWWQPADRGAQRWLGCAHHPELSRGATLTRAVREATEKEAGDGDGLPWPPPQDLEYSGTWWSGPLGGTVWTSRGGVAGLPAVGLACAEDALGPERFEVWQVGIESTARIYEIHSPQDWARLAADHPRDVTRSRRHDWYRWTGHAGPWILPDWPSVARHWDGVHLSVGGYLSTAGWRIQAGEASTLLAGWDADQTLWLNDVFASVTHLTSWEGTPGAEAFGQDD